MMIHFSVFDTIYPSACIILNTLILSINITIAKILWHNHMILLIISIDLHLYVLSILRFSENIIRLKRVSYYSFLLIEEDIEVQMMDGWLRCHFNAYCCVDATQCQNFDFNLRRDHQKNFLLASRLWVGRRKEPILE